MQVKNKRKSCLVYGYFNCNVGDDLFFDILAKRYPHVDFYCYPPSNLLKAYVKMFKHQKNIKFYNKEEKYLKLKKEIPDDKVVLNTFPFLCERLEKVDYFINIGGSIFIQNDQWKKDDRRLLVDIAKDKPKFMLGCNFGPYYEQEYLQFYHEWLKQFNDICFRDKYSYQLFSDLNNTRVAHDIVLNHKKFYSKKKETRSFCY